MKVMKTKGTLQFPASNCLIGFDAEWTKNYKIKNGNVPFCFSIVAVKRTDITVEKLVDGKIPFKYIQIYCENRDETIALLKSANEYAGYIINSLETCVLCGHQVSSDYSVLINMGCAKGLDSLDNLRELQRIWHTREKEPVKRTVDTRYDVDRPFMGKSHRLVDICNDFKLDVSQPELKNLSMTKLQNEFYDKGDYSIYERIAVMNLRHSLSAIVLYWLNSQNNDEFNLIPIKINKTMQYNLLEDFDWIQSNTFNQLL